VARCPLTLPNKPPRIWPSALIRPQAAIQYARVNTPAETTAFDIATAIAAGYAAIIATLALAFNVFSSLRTWLTRVKVTLRRMELVSPGGKPEPVILFELMNRSPHKVKITHVSLAPTTRGGAHLFIPHPLGLPEPAPFEIPARDSVAVWVKPEILADGDPRHKTRAEIKTSDGVTSESKRVRVQALLDGSER